MAALERDDVLKTYRAAGDETRRLEDSADELQASRHDLARGLGDAAERERALRAALDAAQHEARSRAADVTHLQQQVEALSGRQLAAQRRLDAAEAENRKIGDELRAQREIAGAQTAALAGAQQAAAAASDEVSVLRVRASVLEQERSELARRVADERHHGASLEALVAGARIQHAHDARSMGAQIDVLSRENEQLQAAQRATAPPPEPPTAAADEGGSVVTPPES